MRKRDAEIVWGKYVGQEVKCVVREEKTGTNGERKREK